MQRNSGASICRVTLSPGSTTNPPLPYFSLHSEFPWLRWHLTSNSESRADTLTGAQPPFFFFFWWHCESSDPGRWRSAPPGIQNQSPHASLTNHLSIPVWFAPMWNIKHGGGIRTCLNMSLWWRKWGYRPPRLAFTSSVRWPKRAFGVCLLRSSAPQMPKLCKVIHLWEPPPLLIHQRRFTGRWHWSVTHACAPEYHSPHQATVRRHQAQQHSTHGDFDEWIFQLTPCWCWSWLQFQLSACACNEYSLPSF